MLHRVALTAFACMLLAVMGTACDTGAGDEATLVSPPRSSVTPHLPMPDPCPTCDGVFLTGDAADFNVCAVNPGSDDDHDGVSDVCEYKIAYAFAPRLYMSPTDNDTSREPYWAVKKALTPNRLVIMYMFAYHRDTGGWPYGHNGDSEFAHCAVEYDWSDHRWKLLTCRLSAHYQTPNDHTITYTWEQLQYTTDSYGYHNRDNPVIWVSRDKHANYANQDECRRWISQDNCGDDVLGPLFEVVGSRNIGSPQVQFKDCVTSVNVAKYPGMECFWSYAPGHDGKFAGWMGEGGDTPYRDILTSEGWLTQ